MSKRDHEVEVRRLMNALAESVANATDEELREDLAAQQIGPERAGQTLKAMLLQTADEWAAQRRHRAREAWVSSESESRIRPGSGEIPVDRMRDFLGGLLTRKREFAAELTLAHRDFESWTDDDIRSLYQEALALGLAPDDGGDREG